MSNIKPGWVTWHNASEGANVWVLRRDKWEAGTILILGRKRITISLGIAGRVKRPYGEVAFRNAKSSNAPAALELS